MRGPAFLGDTAVAIVVDEGEAQSGRCWRRWFECASGRTLSVVVVVVVVFAAAAAAAAVIAYIAAAAGAGLGSLLASVFCEGRRP
jgi:hypothetical protein